MPLERHRFVEPHVVGREPDVPLRRDLLLRHPMTEHADIASILMNEAHQNPYRGGFAGAVRSDEAHDLPRRQFQTDVVEREESILLAYAVEF